LETFSKRTKFTIASAGLISLIVLALGFQLVSAPPGSTGAPTRLSEYGVTRVYASDNFMGSAKIAIVSDSAAPFFIEKILVILDHAADVDVLLDTVNIDGTGIIQISGYSSTSRVVVLPGGSLIGEVTSSFPTNLQFLFSKDPLGNEALAVSGTPGNGLVVGLRSVSGGYNLGTTLSVIALVTAPANATISMTLSTF
jgi:hypothetical protein